MVEGGLQEFQTKSLPYQDLKKVLFKTHFLLQSFYTIFFKVILLVKKNSIKKSSQKVDQISVKWQPLMSISRQKMSLDKIENWVELSAMIGSKFFRFTSKYVRTYCSMVLLVGNFYNRNEFTVPGTTVLQVGGRWDSLAIYWPIILEAFHSRWERRFPH